MRTEAPSTSAGVEDKGKDVNGDGVGEDASASTNVNGDGGNGSNSHAATNGVGLGIVGKRRLSATAKAGAASMIPVEFPVTGGASTPALAGAVVSIAAPAPSSTTQETSTNDSPAEHEAQDQAQPPSVAAAEQAPVQVSGSLETRSQQTVLPQEQQHHQRHQQHQRHRQHSVAWSIPSVTGSGRGWTPSRTPRVGPPGVGVGGGGGSAHAGIGNVSMPMPTAGAVVAPSTIGRQQSEDSTGGGSAVAAPLSSSTAGGGVGGGGAASRGKRKTEEEKLIQMENRVLHLEAALMRSEVCREWVWRQCILYSRGCICMHVHAECVGVIRDLFQSCVFCGFC